MLEFRVKQDMVVEGRNRYDGSGEYVAYDADQINNRTSYASATFQKRGRRVPRKTTEDNLRRPCVVEIPPGYLQKGKLFRILLGIMCSSSLSILYQKPTMS